MANLRQTENGFEATGKEVPYVYRTWGADAEKNMSEFLTQRGKKAADLIAAAKAERLKGA